MILGALGCLLGAAEQTAVFFEKRVRPVLAANCFACHTTARMGGLRLDSREAALKGGGRGPAIVPGDPERSRLIAAVEHRTEQLKMPPQGKLTEAEIAALREWVKGGAPWPAARTGVDAAAEKGFWSFQPVKRPVVPGVRDKGWVKTDLDAFVLAQIEKNGMRRAGPADKRTLIRRASFDMTGLPPSASEVEAFLADGSPEAFRKVVERLLASPHYGERWGRHWLDVMRYADELALVQAPYAWHYRDWVIDSLNRDLPYDRFVQAHLAADLMPGDNRDLLPALTMLTEATTEFTEDDRVDVVTRGFLGMTVACAQCHDHKYDPIPTSDYYSLAGIFRSSRNREVPLAPPEVVRRYEEKKRILDELQAELAGYLKTESMQVGEALAGISARYLLSAWKVLREGVAAQAVAAQENLDAETLEHWTGYLRRPRKEHPYLSRIEELLEKGGSEEQVRAEATAFERFLGSLLREKKKADEYNHAVSLGARNNRMLGDVVGKTMGRAGYMLWQDLLAEGKPSAAMVSSDATVDGILYYKQAKVERFLPPGRRAYLAALREKIAQAKTELPEKFPSLLVLEDVEEPSDMRVHIRGNAQKLGEIAPRRFLSVIGDGKPFRSGSGRMELARAIANPANPLTARVIVNRLWQHHFGQGIVRSASNFGQTGDRPSNPELLDYLAWRLVESGWSLKALHREILLSAVYALASDRIEANEEADPDNRLHWRFNRRRLDVEELRDAMLEAGGNLDRTVGGPPLRLVDEENNRRSIYRFVSQSNPDPTMTMFDFPSASATSEGRVTTTVPLQRLYFMNNPFVERQAALLAARVQNEATGDEAGIRAIYRILFQRAPGVEEVRIGLRFVRGALEGKAWLDYAQLLMSSNEFLYVD